MRWVDQDIPTHTYTPTDNHTQPRTQIYLLKRLLVTVDTEVGKSSQKCVMSKSSQVWFVAWKTPAIAYLCSR